MYGAPTTYEEAKSILESARKQSEGKAHPSYRKARIFWDDDEKQTNIAVYIFNRRKVLHGNVRETFSEARNSESNRKLLTLYPNGNIRLHTRDHYGTDYGTFYWRGPYEVVRLFLPERIGWSNEAVHPDAGPKPEQKKLKKVDQPRFVAKDGYGWEKRSREKARAWYEEQVKKYGSLEKWFEAYDRYSRKREQQDKAMKEWSKTKTTPLFDGIVIDSDGRALHKGAIEKNEARLRGIERRREAQRRQEARRAEARRREAENERKQKVAKAKHERDGWISALDAQKAKQIRALPEDIQGFLAAKNLIPENDGTVIVYKYARRTNADNLFLSGYDKRTTYVIGERTEDANYQPTNVCGRGLHFGADEADCALWQGRRQGEAFLACRVNLSEAVVVPNNGGFFQEHFNAPVYIVNFDGAKLKAKACVTLGEADPATLTFKQPEEMVVVESSVMPEFGGPRKTPGRGIKGDPYTPEQKEARRKADNERRNDQRAEDKAILADAKKKRKLAEAEKLAADAEKYVAEQTAKDQVEGEVKLRDRSADAKKRAQQ
jgi:hypothetical protein